MSLDEEIQLELLELERVHRRRFPRTLAGAQAPEVDLDGQRVINFASNDYLGLAAHPALVQAAKRSLDENGFGAGASRLVVGNHREHVELEHELGDWMGEGRHVRLFSSGYAANVGLLSALLSPGDVVFSDELNHASIIDGCRLSRASVVVYPHRDLVALEDSLRQIRQTQHRGRQLIVTESLFSMDGDLADVSGLARLAADYNASLMLDEAHAVGILGPTGRGIAASHGVVPDLLVGTLGKAFGAAGAFVAATPGVVDWLWNRARSFVFSTGLPPSTAAAGRAALEIVRDVSGETLRARLQENLRTLRITPALGGAAESPIAPILVNDDQRVMELSRSWLDSKVFVQGIRYPTVPMGTARLRISLSASHSIGQIRQLSELVRCST